MGLRFDASPINSFAWAAGLFDAEGSTSLSDHRSHEGHKMVEASITQGSKGDMPDELTRFVSVIGLGKVYGPYQQEGANEPVFRWRAYAGDDARSVIHVLQPWLGDVKRRQARSAFQVIDGQRALVRGRAEWGSHKTHCVHGHDYATARIRPYVARSSDGVARRPSKQCLVCTREQARVKAALAKQFKNRD